MNIYGKKIILRAMEAEDTELLREMINNPKLEELIVGHSFPTSKTEQHNWIQNNLGDNNNLRLIIETIENGPVGFANIVNIDWKNSQFKISSNRYWSCKGTKEELFSKRGNITT